MKMQPLLQQRTLQMGDAQDSEASPRTTAGVSLRLLNKLCAVNGRLGKVGSLKSMGAQNIICKSWSLDTELGISWNVGLTWN